jgi:hypothetical protein
MFRIWLSDWLAESLVRTLSRPKSVCFSFSVFFDYYIARNIFCLMCRSREQEVSVSGSKILKKYMLKEDESDVLYFAFLEINFSRDLWRTGLPKSHATQKETNISIKDMECEHASTIGKKSITFTRCVMEIFVSFSVAWLLGHPV